MSIPWPFFSPFLDIAVIFEGRPLIRTNEACANYWSGKVGDLSLHSRRSLAMFIFLIKKYTMLTMLALIHINQHARAA